MGAMQTDIKVKDHAASDMQGHVKANDQTMFERDVPVWNKILCFYTGADDDAIDKSRW